MAHEGTLLAIAGDDRAHRALARQLVSAALEADAETCPLRWWPDERTPGSDTVALTGQSDGFYRLDKVSLDLKAHLPGRAFSLRRIRGQAMPGVAPFVDAVRLFALLAPRLPLTVLVLLRDSDGKEKLVEHAETAVRELVAELRPSFDTIIGVAHPEAEAWILALMPAPDSARLREVIQKLSFDPTRQPHKLNSQKTGSRDAKRVLGFLTGEGRTLDDVSSVALPADRIDALLDALDLRAAREAPALRPCGLANFVAQLERLREKLGS